MPVNVDPGNTADDVRVYTVAEVDTLLATLRSAVYTKAEVDQLVKPTTGPPTTPPPTTNRVDVSAFGALGNGTADDTDAVQAAANASVGKSLYFPGGKTYRVYSINIPAGANVTGDGPTSIIKQLTLPANDPRPVFDAASNVTISKIKIDGNRVANRPDRWSDSYCDSGKGYKNTTGGRGRGYRCGIRAESITGVTVDSVEITAVAGAALGTNNSSDVTLTNSNIHDSDFEAAYIYGDGYPIKNVSGTNINITNNTITNLDSPDAAGGTKPDGIVISRAIGGSVSGNTCNGVDRDFLKLESVQNFVVANNTVATGRVGYPAMQISPTTNRYDLKSINIRVTGNKFSGPGFHAAVQINSAQTTPDVARNIEVDHNTITGVSGMRFGVLADSGNGGNVGLTNINIHDNTINGTTTYAIYINGGGTGLSLQNNTHDGKAMTNVSIPGPFPCCHTQN